LDPL
jgi:hypothetical protein